MTIREMQTMLEKWAPLPLQESYDNAGLITGDADWQCTGVLCTLDATEAIVGEAVANRCNLIVAHHPIVFGALKKFSTRSYVEKTLIKAIKNDIAIYAIHTNLDNIQTGVNAEIARRVGLVPESLKVLAPQKQTISKLYTYVPVTEGEALKAALFAAGAGNIGLYEECSFSTTGMGTFKPLHGSHPAIGQAGGPRENVDECKLEVIFPSYLQTQILKALHQAHSYEVPAYEVIQLENVNQQVGAGMIGELAGQAGEAAFLSHLKNAFNLSVVRHTPLLGKPVQKVALCGGAGSFLTKQAIAAGADVYITGDVKYHEFFDADGKLVLADIGHWESEQFTIDLLANFLRQKFPTFAVLKTGLITNPVHYYV